MDFHLCTDVCFLFEVWKSGIYKLTYKGCSGVYLGHTGRNFELRKKEPFKSYRNNADDPTLAKHPVDLEHKRKPLWKFYILSKKGSRINLLEVLKIYKLGRDGFSSFYTIKCFSKVQFYFLNYSKISSSQIVISSNLYFIVFFRMIQIS